MQYLKKTFLLFLFISIFSKVYCQEPENNPLIEFQQTNLDYFRLNREYVFLHFNKTQVAPQENIWFSAYVYDLRNNTPHPVTTNLTVALFNEGGQQLACKTVFINQGIGKGWFHLPRENYKPGKYFIKASTNYMRNFKEELEFVQAFEILGNSTTAEETAPSTKYDLQVLPEGGHLLAEINNVVGVKLIDEKGKGVLFKNAEVVNSKGKIITSFDSNQFGISRFNLSPSTTENYSVKLKTESGDSLKVAVPQAEKNGLVLKTNNFLANQVIFSLETNQETLPLIEDKEFYITYHQQHRFKGLQVSFSEHPKLGVSLNREHLFPGINIVSIFDEDGSPILERMIFNPIGIKRESVSARISKNLGDSLLVELRNKSSLDTLLNISVSVLPKRTKAYQPKHNILSAFLLKPYIKSEIGHAGYYFNHPNERERWYDLDLLLLTQGWSKYDWRNINNFMPQENFENEVGFTISGTINDKNSKSKNVFITSGDTQLLELAQIQQNNKFELKNLFIRDSSSVHFGLLNDKDKKIIRSNYAVAVLPFKKQLSIDQTQTKDFFSSPPKGHLTSIDSENFIQNTVSLDTVLLKGKKEAPQKESNLFDEVTYIDEDMRNRFQYITDYIATQNFNVVRSMGSVSITSRRSSTIHGSLNTLVVLDGFPLTDDLSMIANMLISQVESIRIDKSGMGYGIFGANGVIEINTRFDYGNEEPGTSKLFTFTANNGFASDKEFYAPKYTDYNSELFLDYGVIHWDPELIIENKGSASFKIPNTLTENMTLYVEGMSKNGYLISEQIDLDSQ